MKTPKAEHLKNSTAINYNPIWISFVILFVGLVVTFIVSNSVSYEEESQSQKEFVLLCNDIKSKIATRINFQAQFLLSGSSLFEASQSVTREEWRLFNKFSSIDRKYTGVEGFGYSLIVKNTELKNHISVIHKEGFPKYKIFPEGTRDINTTVIYIEPLDERNSKTLGFDMFTEPVRRKAMEQARDYHMPILSGKVILLQEGIKIIQKGTLMYVPVYKNGPINTIAERRAAIIGWVFSPFLMDDFVNSILGHWNLSNETNIRLQIYDDGTILPNALLFDSQKFRTSNTIETKVRTRILPILFNKKRWTLVFSQPSEHTFYLSHKTLIIAIGGIIISFLLFALSYSLLITKKRAKIIAERLTLDLSIKNQEYERINISLNKNYKELISSKIKLNEINNELQKAIVKAEESDQLKSAFLANMSHEIRTPMNGIIGFAELLKEGNLSSDKQNDYIKIIEKSGIRLLNIINDIVDVSKIEAGQMNVVLSTTNVDEQMQYIQTFFRPEAQDKGIQLVLKNYLVEGNTIITTDREKLYAILINLVKNAIKYTVKGTIEFGYQIKDNYIEFFVKDTGIGISKDRHTAIFKRFIQAEINDKMARQGAGLGLSIAKAYVELLGGNIWVESEPEIGSTFYFTLPNTIKLDDNPIQKSAFNNPVNFDSKRLKILIAEDDKISMMLIQKVVEPYSKEIIKAKSGLEAVEICRNNPDLDLILMDIQMPQMNGYEATKEIRKFNKNVIILAQTAFALEGDKEKSIEAGCNDYISKPIKKEELSRLILHYFGNKQN